MSVIDVWYILSFLDEYLWNSKIGGRLELEQAKGKML